jgi:hypothetical protein
VPDDRPVSPGNPAASPEDRAALPGDRAVRGFAHHHTDEELRAYAALTPEQKMRWLYEAWRFTADALPPERREAWMKMRRGEI